MATLYEGRAQRVVDTKRQTAYIVVQEEDRVFALTLVTETTVCQREGWQTEHPKIMVMNLNGSRPVGENRTVTSQDTDLLAYVNSKLLYAEQTSRRHVESAFVNTIYRRCLLHREILRNRLITAPLSPSAVGKLIKGQQGYIGRVLGEVLYLVKCTPRPATLRRSSHCYNELPVTVNNQSKFLSPVTHIILNYAEEIDCSPLTPPMFQINKRWIGFIPEPVLRDAPIVMEPEREERVDFTPIHSISGGGLYTNEEVRRSQKLILFGSERKAVESIILRRISGGETDNQGLQTLKLFDEEELKKLATSSIRVLWGVGRMCERPNGNLPDLPNIEVRARSSFKLLANISVRWLRRRSGGVSLGYVDDMDPASTYHPSERGKRVGNRYSGGGRRSSDTRRTRGPGISGSFRD